MKNQYIQNTRTYLLNVGSSDVNELGVYTSCSLLQEIARANDTTVMAAFATSNLAAIHATHYNVNFMGVALKGDTLKIESAYAMTADGSISVRVSVSKTSKRVNIAICAGSFTFINTKRVKTTTYYADTVLA